MIEQFYYLLALLVSISGMLVLDKKYKLAFWFDKKRTYKTLGITMLVFIVWDVLGIALGIFFHGGSKYTLPIRIAPEFPIEELFFLFLLCYVSLVLYTGWSRVCKRT